MNIIKNTIVLLSMVFSSLMAITQELSVKSVVELTNDITARTQVRNDANGQACAMLRVNAPSMMVSFDQNIVGDVSVLPGEYIVYVPEATSTIQVKNQEESIDVDFSKFDINLEGKKCYRIILEKESNSKVTGVGKLAISANYDNAVVMVDGVPMGQVPLLLENVSPGRHTIAVPNTIGVTMKDITTYVKEGETTVLKLTLHKETRKPVEIKSLTLQSGDMPTVDDPVIHTFGVNIVEKYGKKGVVDYMGNVLVPFKFDYISPVKVNGLYRVNTHDNIDGKLLTNFKWGLYKPGIGLVADLNYDAIYDNSLINYLINDIVSERSKYMPARRNMCWGLLDPNGKEVTRSFRRYQYKGKPIYCESPELCKNVVKVKASLGSNYGLISYDGKIITELKYEYIGDFSEGVARFERDGIQGLLDESGKEILILPSNLKFPYSSMNDGLILVEDINTKKRGFINKNGALVIPCKYDDGYKFKHGLCSVKKEDSWMIIDRNDHIVCHGGDILEDIYGKVNGQKGLTARLESPYFRKRRDDGKYDILLASGQLFIPSCTYDGKYDYNYGHNRYLMGDKSLYVILDDEHIYNKDGDKIFDFDGIDYDVIVKDGFIRIRNRSTRSYGFISEQGEILFNCIYGENDKPSSEAAPISEASDEESSEEGYNIDWDTSYETVITGYEGISEGLAVLSLGDRYGFIDNTGKVVVPLIYTAVTPFEDGVALVRDQNGKWSKIHHEEIDSMRFDFE